MSQPTVHQARSTRPRSIHNACALRSALLVALATGASAGTATAGSTITFDEPTIDRWNYPFNFTPGARGSISVFSALPEPAFDNREGQFYLAYDTGTAIEPDLGPDAYNVQSITIRVMVERVGSTETFLYDPTEDPWQSYLEPDDPDAVADDDPGRPVELFGVGFRNGWSVESFAETTPFCPDCDCFTDCVTVRNAYPIDFDDAGEPRDVSNNVNAVPPEVLDRFQPRPWAIGAVDDVEPGALVPDRTEMIFTIDVDDPDVQCYLREQLDQGRLAFMISSLHRTEQMGTGSYPVFFAKENIDVPSSAAPARLSIDVELNGSPGGSGDLTGDGQVNVFDLLELLGQWGACEGCPADLTGDNAVNVFDLLELLGNWGSV